MTQHSLAIGAFNEDLRSVHKESGISAAILARFARVYLFSSVFWSFFLFLRVLRMMTGTTKMANNARPIIPVVISKRD